MMTETPSDAPGDDRPRAKFGKYAADVEAVLALLAGNSDAAWRRAQEIDLVKLRDRRLRSGSHKFKTVSASLFSALNKAASQLSDAEHLAERVGYKPGGPMATPAASIALSALVATAVPEKFTAQELEVMLAPLEAFGSWTRRPVQLAPEPEQETPSAPAAAPAVAPGQALDQPEIPQRPDSPESVQSPPAAPAPQVLDYTSGGACPPLVAEWVERNDFVPLQPSPPGYGMMDFDVSYAVLPTPGAPTWETVIYNRSTVPHGRAVFDSKQDADREMLRRLIHVWRRDQRPALGVHLMDSPIASVITGESHSPNIDRGLWFVVWEGGSAQFPALGEAEHYASLLGFTFEEISAAALHDKTPWVPPARAPRPAQE